VIAVGGVAKKSPFVMQTVADVLDMPIQVVRTEQPAALGAAMCAAAAAGLYGSLKEAQKAMGGGFEKTYVPDKKKARTYRALYDAYLRAGRFIENELRI
jgi:L-ribulokinase